MPTLQPQKTPPTLDPARYRNNVAALRTRQPEVAAAIDQQTIPESWALQTGRDGQLTFRSSDRLHDSPWLGKSSMPSISATELFAGFSGDGCNVALPGILTGIEPLVVSSGLPKHAALFVFENELVNFKLAMQLYDYESLIRAGRLVFIREHCLQADYHELFTRYPGYEPVAQLLTAPQRSPAQFADLQRQVEATTQPSIQLRLKQTVEITERLAAVSITALPASPSVAVIGVDPRPWGLANVACVQRALGELGWSCELCVPDAPDQCHAIARLNAIDRGKVDFVLAMNGCPASFVSLLPSTVRVASWVWPDSTISATHLAPPSRNHAIFATSVPVRDALIATGMSAAGVHLLEPAADVASLCTKDASSPTRGNRAAIVMDLPDDSAQACGMTLPSHVVLWNMVRDVVVRKGNNLDPSQAKAWLEQAQQESGVELSEEGVKSHFEKLILSRVNPACIACKSAVALVGTGIDVAVWGQGWPDKGITEQGVRGPIPLPGSFGRVLETTGFVVFPQMTHGFVALALEALGCGVAVFAGGSSEPWSVAYPDLSPVLSHVRFYQRFEELVTLVKSSLGGTGFSEQARDCVLNGHTFSHRIRSIAEHFRKANLDNQEI